MEARATVAAAATQVSDLSTTRLLSRPTSVLAASASGLPSVAVLAPPRRAVRSETPRAAPRAFVRRIQRARRRSLPGDGDGDEEALYGGDVDDGAFGGSGGGGGGGCGGGRWWDFEGWEESGSSPSSCDRAFDFVCGVISCAALYSCTQFAFDRVCRFMAAKEKTVPSPLIIPRIAG